MPHSTLSYYKKLFLSPHRELRIFIKDNLALLSLLLSSWIVHAQTPLQWSEKMASTARTLWKDPHITGKASFSKWSYDEGVLLKGMKGLWKLTGNGDYFRYIRHSMDCFVNRDGTIKGYQADNYRLDDINNGKILLMLYRVTGKKEYWEAATQLRDQLKTQPRTPQGGFWHKKVYPNQMWLDGLYMAEPFYAEYAMLAHEGDTSFADITHQFILMEEHARDPKTGLLYHGWDASKQQKWANPVTGDSRNFWDRAIGWYAMGLVDALDYLPVKSLSKAGFPKYNPYRDSLIHILDKLAAAIAQYQDPASGCWWQVMDKGNRKGNFLEASGSCMFVYTLAKGVREGYLSSKYLQVAEKGFNGILKQFISNAANGQMELKGTCPVAGLGGKPYRDGSYQYYVDQKPVINDPKGIGAFILAANEMAISKLRPEGQGITVTLDNYFNHELKKDITGKVIPYHYTWDDMENSGFSLWGNIFGFRGVKTNTLQQLPDTRNLRHTNIYIIVDPDTKAETAHPNYIGPKDIHVIYNWVKSGGILVLMANDSGNCEFNHLNQLAAKLGFHFNEDSRNHVQAHHFEQGALYISRPNPIFKKIKKVYIKELTSIGTGRRDIPVLFTKDNYTAAIIAHVGKGLVFASGDPWFYNEYTDGRKLPEEYQNYQAACELTDWLIAQSRDEIELNAKNSKKIKN